MEKTVSVNCQTPEGYDVSSVEYDIPNITKQLLKSAKVGLNACPIAKCIEIEGSHVWSTVKQFDSEANDPNKKEIVKGNTFEFRSDVQRIKLYPSGYAELIAQNKWNNNEILSFDLDI